jgi:ADP-heptose:LPS heptosyltransferase
MSSALQRLPDGARVAVIRLRSLGDCVLTTPALRILKQSRPDLSVAVVVEERFAAIFDGNPDVDAVLRPDLASLRQWEPRLCLNLHGGTRSLWLTLASGAPVRAGFGHFRAAFAYNVRIPSAQEIFGVDRTVHTVEHLASAMFHLGAARCEIPRAWLFAEARVAERPYAIVHPFATGPGKAWTSSGFLAIAAHLRSAFELEPVFIGSASDDLAPYREYCCVSGAPLAEVKSLLAGASLFAGNDSGPAHMAAAFGTPALVIFGATDPRIWGPWKSASQTVVARGSIYSIEVTAVIEALDRLKVAA